ncbi:Fic/DOC family protein [Clostridium estertheticum]|uniref:Fic/DOC family protein n=1 Tax=Clostridium estertheticum TaxID=238834 RepID=UPI001C7E032A|nr:Fic family protein [Clostridium estertheticum]MBX4267147.1 Fic family protein [Clostridium estertheticum]MBX4272013.1 Fic family protein [Clostridium estertheticum]WLC82450.1 Fic family protein [Clostridium estertheticum]WLC91270.1 Fic family protein [Clostridium estertheticum]
MKDPYIYPGTEILINKFNIKNADELERIEKEYTALGVDEIRAGKLKGDWDLKHLKDIHKHLLGDIYSWAGNLRTINIVKSESVLGGLSVNYSDFKNVKKDISLALKKLNSINWNKLSLDDKTHEFSKSFSDVWGSHGFREGNTRTTATFFCEFAKDKGFPLNDKLLSNNSAYVRSALVASFFEDKEDGIERNFKYIEKIIRNAIKEGPSYSKEIDNRSRDMKLISPEINKESVKEEKQKVNKSEKSKDDEFMKAYLEKQRRKSLAKEHQKDLGIER